MRSHNRPTIMQTMIVMSIFVTLACFKNMQLLHKMKMAKIVRIPLVKSHNSMRMRSKLMWTSKKK